MLSCEPLGHNVCFHGFTCAVISLLLLLANFISLANGLSFFVIRETFTLHDAVLVLTMYPYIYWLLYQYICKAEALSGELTSPNRHKHFKNNKHICLKNI